MFHVRYYHVAHCDWRTPKCLHSSSGRFMQEILPTVHPAKRHQYKTIDAVVICPYFQPLVRSVCSVCVLPSSESDLNDRVHHFHSVLAAFATTKSCPSSSIMFSIHFSKTCKTFPGTRDFGKMNLIFSPNLNVSRNVRYYKRIINAQTFAEIIGHL